MATVSGHILSSLEVISEYGQIEIFKNTYSKGEKVWMYYNKHGTLLNIEPKKDIPVEDILPDDTTLP